MESIKRIKDFDISLPEFVDYLTYEMDDRSELVIINSKKLDYEFVDLPTKLSLEVFYSLASLSQIKIFDIVRTFWDFVKSVGDLTFSPALPGGEDIDRFKRSLSSASKIIYLMNNVSDNFQYSEYASFLISYITDKNIRTVKEFYVNIIQDFDRAIIWIGFPDSNADPVLCFNENPLRSLFCGCSPLLNKLSPTTFIFEQTDPSLFQQTLLYELTDSVLYDAPSIILFTCNESAYISGTIPDKLSLPLYMKPDDMKRIVAKLTLWDRIKHSRYDLYESSNTVIEKYKKLATFATYKLLTVALVYDRREWGLAKVNMLKSYAPNIVKKGAEFVSAAYHKV